MTIRRAPLPPELVPPACDTPPADLGIVTRPPHPILGAGFAALIGLGLQLGAITTASPRWSAFLVACMAAGVCLGAVMHFCDGTALGHVAAKLACRLPRWRWIAAAAMAIIPAVLLAGRSPRIGTAAALVTSVSDLAIYVLALVAAAIWIEAVARGYAFRACMGRHGFVLAATIGGILSIAGMLPLTLAFELSPLQRVMTLALEIPLSFALAALVWRSESCVPALFVRLMLLAAIATTGNALALAPAALILWIAAARR